MSDFIARPSIELRASFDQQLDALVRGFQSSDDDAVAAASAWINRHSVRELPALELYKLTFGSTRRVLIDTLTGAGPCWHDDLTWDRALEALQQLVSGSLSSAGHDFVLAFLEANLPHADLCGMTYGTQFRDDEESLMLIAFTPEQLLAFAMHRAGRILTGSPDVDLPYTPEPRRPSGPIAL